MLIQKSSFDDKLRQLKALQDEIQQEAKTNGLQRLDQLKKDLAAAVDMAAGFNAEINTLSDQLRAAGVLAAVKTVFHPVKRSRHNCEHMMERKILYPQLRQKLIDILQKIVAIG